MKMIAMKNDRFLIVYLTAMEKQTCTIMVISLFYAKVAIAKN